MEKVPRNINPSFERQEYKSYNLDECIKGISSDRQILSFLISKAESSKEGDIQFVEKVLSQTTPNKANRRVAVSGSPGVGKSTFINSYGKLLLDRGKQIAILPVDPTSNLSKGSILGDKTRMDKLIGAPGVYIKPMASALALGGAAPSTMISQMLCERAGFDYTIIETVGVGQSEYEVRNFVDCFLLLLQPGGGDELQGIKRGIMEMADILVVNKSDGQLESQAKLTLEAHKSILSLMHQNEYGWKTKVTLYSSVLDHDGMNLPEAIDGYFQQLEDNGAIAQLRNKQNRNYALNKADGILLHLMKTRGHVSEVLATLEEEVTAEGVNPVSALLKFKEACKNEIG